MPVAYWVRSEPVMPTVGQPDLEGPLYAVRRPRLLTPIMAMDKMSAQSAFIRSRKAENGYARQLRALAAHIGRLITGVYDPAMADGNSPLITDLLRRYASTIQPWSETVGRRMITEVAARDRAAWRRTAAKMGSILQRDLDSTDIGHVVRQRLADQVELITSLPLDAAKRVHELTLRGITEGARAKEIAAEIMRSGEVTKSRATLIARTEVGRTSTELTKARAESIGSTEFIWRTIGDSDVRPSHRALNGRTFRWDDPPECDPGHHALPGAIWNCRCFAEPVVPDLY